MGHIESDFAIGFLFYFFRFWGWTSAPTQSWEMQWNEEFRVVKGNGSQQVLACRLITHWSCLISKFLVLVEPCDSSSFFRGNDNWSYKSSIHGWDIQWFRHLNHLSDRHVSSAIDSHNRFHHFGFTSPASSWDIWPIWWHHLDGQGQSRVPWASGQHSRVLWAMWLSLPDKKRSCWFLARGMISISPSFYGITS